MNEMAKKRIVYSVPGMEDIPVREAEYAEGRTVRVYGRGPALICVTGYPDPGFEQRMGCRIGDMGHLVSWGQLLAASGFAAITYVNHEPADAKLAIAYVRAHAEDLGVDATRLGVFATSGNGPMGLGSLDAQMRCGVFLYPYLLGAGPVAEQIGFADPLAGKTAADLPDLPIFIARAGRDAIPGLNASIDAFAAAALARNLPLTLVNHPNAPHAFDLMDDSDATRAVIRSAVEFVRVHL